MTFCQLFWAMIRGQSAFLKGFANLANSSRSRDDCDIDVAEFCQDI